MQVKVSRSGGVAGRVRRGVLELDDASPSALQWAELMTVADEVQTGRPGPVRDGFTWTIEAAGRRAVIPDRQLAGPLRELAQQVLGR